ncbi:hypothetical protein FQN54_007868 [Arachnomyces sp. PD_36]|nr:hypothetical protein FQN54_007868 [Arachnomyces sp. PD_36]
MPHADASYFAPGLSKAEVYEQVLDFSKALADGQRNWPGDPADTASPAATITNLANTSSLLWHAYAALPTPSSSVNWAGFYIRSDKFPSPHKNATTTLLLGPFHGKPACQLIAYGRGVCGTAASEKRTVMVGDVNSFPGHIACDGESKSEIVVPIVVGGETVAIIDIDCAEYNGFDDTDKNALEKLAVILGESCDW